MGQKTNKTVVEPEINLEGCDYETAISHAGFGKFNILLLIIGIPSGWSSMLETSTMSYVFPAAQCDLELSLQDKGMLNAATYIGMVCSAVFWGLVADSWGRKKLLVLGFLLDGFLIILSGFSQSYAMLLICKLLGGFVINGPLAAFLAYLAEFHSAKHRTRIVIIRGLIVHSAKFVLPLLAWSVFPLNLNLSLLGDRIVLHSWSIFLFLCATPSLFCGFVYIFMPETPKFLMTKGETQKAIEVFSLVYSLNTGRPRESFPIKSLLNEKANTVDGESKLRVAFQQAAQIFSGEYRWHALLMCVLQLGIVFSGNPIRLWLPQIFTAINDYHSRYNTTSGSLCEIMETIQNTGSSETKATSSCEVNMTGNFLYVNTLVVAGVCLLGFIVSTAIVNFVGKKPYLITLSTCCGILISCMYFSTSSEATLSLASIAVTEYNICTSLIQSFTVDLFPTTFRTLILAVVMASSRIGAVLGNILFPVLLESGCLQTFLVFGSTAIAAGMLSFFAPNIRSDETLK